MPAALQHIVQVFLLHLGDLPHCCPKSVRNPMNGQWVRSRGSCLPENRSWPDWRLPAPRLPSSNSPSADNPHFQLIMSPAKLFFGFLAAVMSRDIEIPQTLPCFLMGHADLSYLDVRLGKHLILGCRDRTPPNTCMICSNATSGTSATTDLIQKAAFRSTPPVCSQYSLY